MPDLLDNELLPKYPPAGLGKRRTSRSLQPLGMDGSFWEGVGIISIQLTPVIGSPSYKNLLRIAIRLPGTLRQRNYEPRSLSRVWRNGYSTAM